MDKSAGLILSVSPYRETTLLIRLLLAEGGVARAMARGARRGQSNKTPQAAFEPLAVIQAGLKRRSPTALGTLSEVNLVRGWPALRSDLTKLAYASLGIEMLGTLAADSPPHPDFFAEGLEYLSAMESTAAPGSLAIALLLRWLHHAGYPPRLDESLRPDALSPSLTWHFDTGIFSAPKPGDSTRALRLRRAEVAAILPFFLTPPMLDASFQLQAGVGRGLLRWLILVWEDHLHARLKSAEFLARMILR